MPRYFFDVIAGGAETRDGTGWMCDDDDAARAKAEAILDALAREAPGSCTVTVRDESGTMIAKRIVVRG